MTGLRITAIDVGPLKLEKFKLVALGQGIISVPTTAAIIEHPRHGVIIWDTGINHVVADPERADAYWGTGVRDAFGAQGFTREHAIDAQLMRLGYKAADVRFVLYSHLHLDHAGGMSYFPNAVHVVQRDEIRYALWPDAWTRVVYCQNDFQNIRSLNIMEIDGDFDLLNNGEIRLIKAPGHTPGHQALVLDLPHHGRICLGADIAHQRDQFNASIPMPWDWSSEAMSMTRMRMQQLERSNIPVFICHEPLDFAKLPRNGEFWD
jgi:N-acyl homoserine lactone hydrolase